MTEPRVPLGGLTVTWVVRATLRVAIMTTMMRTLNSFSVTKEAAKIGGTVLLRALTPTVAGFPMPLEAPWGFF
eukprot:12405479-Heterocapsa_arctica.AAC.1